MKKVCNINNNTKEEWNSKWEHRLSTNNGLRNITTTGEGNGDLHIYEVASLKYIKNNCSILEIGCGDGFYLKYIKDHFENIDEYGVDISDYGIQYAKEKYGIKCQAIKNLEKFTNRKFDIIICHQVIEHTDAPKIFLDYITSFLTDDGQLLLSSVTDQSNYDRMHTYCFDKQDFNRLLNKIFEDVKIEILDVPSRPKSQILGIARIKKGK